MKLVLFSGSHPRHLFINRSLLDYFDDVLVILMQRGKLMPEPAASLADHDKALFLKHFENRVKVEKHNYGDLNADEVYKDCNVIKVNSEELNSSNIAKRIVDFNPDFCFIFGVKLILDPVIDILPENKINLHLGLSPWYKGGATLYWPFYHLEPQFCGATFHQINHQADAGEIVHQCVPSLERGDSIHDVGAKCVLKAKEDIPKLLNHWLTYGKFEGKVQNTSGRNWRGQDFHASQLRVIYDLFNDDIVDAYLDKKLGLREPNLFSCIDICES